MEENIVRLIKRYKKKIEWLLKQNNNTIYNNGMIEGLEIAIHDLEDLKDGIDM
jgi:hypothetical protein